MGVSVSCLLHRFDGLKSCLLLFETPQQIRERHEDSDQKGRGLLFLGDNSIEVLQLMTVQYFILIRQQT